MIVQNNPAPWVILAFVVMLGCITVGMLLGDVGPFSSEIASAKIQITQTQASINALATQSAMELAQTQQAPLAKQTVVAAEMTTIPLQQTATSMAELNSIQFAQMNATQTAIEVNSQNSQIIAQATQTAINNSSYLQNLISNATATAIANSQINAKNASVSGYIAGIIGVLTISGWVIIHVITKAITARAQEKAAHARLLAEQRRLASLRASIQAERKNQSYQNPVPTSLMKNPGNRKDLPRAE